MIKEKGDSIGFVNVTNDGGVKKKIFECGFGATPVDGQEIHLHYSSELEDGRILENTRVGKDVNISLLGNKIMIPGLEIGIKSMKMGEKAVLKVQPEYGYLALEKLKAIENNEDLTNDFLAKNIYNLTTDIPDNLHLLEPKEAQKYSTIYFEIELIKFDKPRKNKIQMEPEERVSEAAILKKEGNELFQENRHREAIVKYETGLHYLTQMPTDFLTTKVIELRLQLTLNITMCHNSMNEYSYALRRVKEAMDIMPTPKCFYYRCVRIYYNIYRLLI